MAFMAFLAFAGPACTFRFILLEEVSAGPTKKPQTVFAKLHLREHMRATWTDVSRLLLDEDPSRPGTVRTPPGSIPNMVLLPADRSTQRRSLWGSARPPETNPGGQSAEHPNRRTAGTPRDSNSYCVASPGHGHTARADILEGGVCGAPESAHGPVIQTATAWSLWAC